MVGLMELRTINWSLKSHIFLLEIFFVFFTLNGFFKTHFNEVICSFGRPTEVPPGPQLECQMPSAPYGLPTRTTVRMPNAKCSLWTSHPDHSENAKCQVLLMDFPPRPQCRVCQIPNAPSGLPTFQPQESNFSFWFGQEKPFRRISPSKALIRLPKSFWKPNLKPFGRCLAHWI